MSVYCPCPQIASRRVLFVCEVSPLTRRPPLGIAALLNGKGCGCDALAARSFPTARERAAALVTRIMTAIFTKLTIPNNHNLCI